MHLFYRTMTPHCCCRIHTLILLSCWSVCFFISFSWLTESCCCVGSVLFTLSLVGNLVLLVGMRVALAALGGSPALRMRRVRRILRCSCILRKVLFVAR